MQTNDPVTTFDQRKLKHDFLNDINSLRMGIEALEMLRDDPVEFAELVDVMRETVKVFEDRLAVTFDILQDKQSAS